MYSHFQWDKIPYLPGRVFSEITDLNYEEGLWDE